jgi:hypothetical protein
MPKSAWHGVRRQAGKPDLLTFGDRQVNVVDAITDRIFALDA